MNCHLASTCAAIALAMLSTTAFSAEPTISIEFPKAMSSAAALADAPFAPTVRLGETQIQINDTLGEPDFRLTENGWVYQNVKVAIDGVARPELHNLVIVFNRGKVISIRVAPDTTLDRLVADARKGAEPVTVASSTQH